MAEGIEKRSDEAVAEQQEPKEEPTTVVDTDVLEEDDDFEEFEDDHWDEALPRVEDDLQWEDNWDDEEDDDNFANRLRAELEKADRENTSAQ